jgi:ABC-type dipeptide/oligopeptide/nickel transport system permease component
VIAWLWRRLLLAVAVLVATFAMAFVLVRAAPDGPFDPWRAGASPVAADLSTTCRSDEPMAPQLVSALAAWGSGSVDACTGRSLVDGAPVLDRVAQALSPTIGLALLALAVALIGGAVGGAGLAWTAPESAGARAGRAVLAVVQGLPGFVLAAIAVLVGALTVPLFSPVRPAGIFALVPPATLGLAFAARTADVVRRALAGPVSPRTSEVFAERRLTQSRGFGRRTVGDVRAALAPALAGLAPLTSALVMGGIAVEVAFSLPGLGSLVVKAAQARDYNVMLGGVLAYSALLLGTSLAADLLHRIVDRRGRGRA